MPIDYTTKNIYFEPLNLIYDILNKYVPDINDVRLNRDKEGQRKWIFPSYPESNDENYPRIAVMQGRAYHVDWTPLQLETTILNVNDQTFYDVYSNLVTLPVTIGIFVKKTKDKAFQVTDYDGTRRYVQNGAQVLWLMDRAMKAILAHRSVFIQKGIDMTIIDQDAPFEDNDFLWAGMISLELVYLNRWTTEFFDGGTAGDNTLISTADLGGDLQDSNITVIPKGDCNKTPVLPGD